MNVKRKNSTNGGATDETARYLNKYREAIRKVWPIPTPDQFRRFLTSLSLEPSPSDVFQQEHIPHLEKLWIDARISRERYLQNLAEALFHRIPQIVDESKRRTSVHGE